MRSRAFVFAASIGCILVSTAWADSLQLKNGSLIKGRYLGGSETEVRFQVGSAVQEYPVAEIVSLTFENAAGTTASKEAPHVLPAPEEPTTALAEHAATPQRATTVTIPSGTRITVRTIDAIDSEHNRPGDKFQGSLEEAIVIGDATVVPKGADVYGRLAEATEAGHIQGRSELRLELTSLVVNGETFPLVTGDYSVSGSSRGATTAKRVGGGAAAGAVIGAIAGGGKGAAIGAGVGAGAGTAVQVMTKGQQVRVPSETLLEFTLQESVRVPASEVSRN